MDRGKRRKIEPTDDWDLLVPLFEWPEQRDYEELRPVTLFGASVAERATETGTPERTLYRKIERFERDGMLSLFATDPATARRISGAPSSPRAPPASSTPPRAPRTDLVPYNGR
jgi:hypothetical protein